MAAEKFSRESVQAQADAIKAYWERRGYKVVTSVTLIDGSEAGLGDKGARSGWQLHTDMIAGLPRELFYKNVNAEKARR